MVPADESDAPTPDLIGRTIDGRFEIVELIGTGGMGAVYRAQQSALHRDVAIKVLHPGRRHSRDAVTRFMREARTSSQLAHPNTVSVFDFGQTDDGLLYLVMELVQGRTLTEVASEGRLSVGRVLRISAQLCHALEAAHGLGIVHCDLKPSNIVILDEPSDRDHAVVLDFGLARALSEDEVTESADGAIAGTPAYMSPEAISADRVDERSDLYSLGIVMYELLAGRRPFRASSVAAMCLAQLEHAPPPLPSSVPRTLSSIVMQLLSKSEHDRPASAEIVRVLLSRIRAPVGPPVDHVSTTGDDALLDTRTVRGATATGTRVDLPTQPGDLIARNVEVERGVALLGRSGVRLVTLTGPGGTGKTRLAIELARSVADQFDRVRFVALAHLTDPNHVLRAIASGLGVGDELAADLMSACAGAVGRRRWLLIVDNAEHVLAGARVVGDLIAAIPRLTIIVTTRELLRVRDEHELAIPPLSPVEAARLFASRARAALPAFDAAESPPDIIDRICAAVDRLPLAIELAAARAKVLSLHQLLERLERSTSVLSRGPADAPDRHRSLRAAMDASFELLDGDERAVFRGLGVFAGGADLEAVEAVVHSDALDLVAALIDKSLVRRSGVTHPRFWMLETIREYAAGHLAATPERDAVRRRHAEHYLAVAESFAPVGYLGMVGEGVLTLERDRSNVRAALDWSIEQGAVDLAQRGAAAMTRLWEARCRYEEGISYLERALALGGDAAGRARVLAGLGTLRWRAGDFERAFEDHVAAAEQFGEVGDGIAEAFAVHNAGVQLIALDRVDEGRMFFDRTLVLAERTGDHALMAIASASLAVASIRGHTPQHAVDRLEPTLATLSPKRGDFLYSLVAYNLALAYWHLERLDEATSLWIEVISRYDLDAGEVNLLDSLSPCAPVLLRHGLPREAARVLGALGRHRADVNYVLDVEEQQLIEEGHAAARQALGPEVDDLIAEGAEMSLEDVVVLVLELVG